MAKNKKASVGAKRTLLKLDSSKKSRLNSSRTVDEVTYYSLNDVETIVQSVLAEMASDPTVGVTLSESETGISLNCVNEEGEEYTVEVELENEDGDVVEEDVTVEEDFDSSMDEKTVDVTSSRRHRRSRR